LAPTAWEFPGGPPELWHLTRLWRLRRLQEFPGGPPELWRLMRLWRLRRLQEFLGDPRIHYDDGNTFAMPSLGSREGKQKARGRRAFAKLPIHEVPLPKLPSRSLPSREGVPSACLPRAFAVNFPAPSRSPFSCLLRAFAANFPLPSGCLPHALVGTFDNRFTGSFSIMSAGKAII